MGGSPKRRGFHLVSSDELLGDHFDLEAAFRRDPDGLCHAVGKSLNELLAGDPYMTGWRWSIDWHNLPGAISVSVSGTACGIDDWDCPAFFAATSVAAYEEVDAAALRLKERILKALRGWKR
jgi:prophage tail gpP-like protein